MIIYYCKNCGLPFTEVSAFHAHKTDCRIKYRNKPRYEKIELESAAMPNRYHPKTRAALYQLLAEIWGDRCIHCKRPPARAGPLEIDHVNNDFTDWNHNNLRLMCKACNLHFRGLTTKAKVLQIQKDSVQSVSEAVKEGERSYEGVSFVKNIVDYSQGSAEMQANNYLEVRFKDWLIGYLSSHRQITKREAVTAGAEYAGCAVRTAENYLSKLTSLEGPLREYKSDVNQTIITRKIINQS